MKKIIIALIILLTSTICFAEPFDWDNEPAEDDTTLAAAVIIVQTQNGLTVKWTADALAEYGYTVKVRDWESRLYKTVRKTYETELAIVNLYSMRIYEIFVYRIEINGDHTLIAQGIKAFNYIQNNVLYGYEGDGWHIGLALTNANDTAMLVCVQVGNFFKDVTVPAYGTITGSLNNIFGIEFEQGGYPITLPYIPGVGLMAYQITASKNEYSQTAK